MNVRALRRSNIAEALKNAKWLTPEEAPVVEMTLDLRAGNPSGEAPPMGDLPGWKDIFTDDFNEYRWDHWNFPHSFQYEYSWIAGIATVGNSVMTFPFNRANENELMVTAWACCKENSAIDVQYGKFLVRMRGDKHYNSAFAALTWPRSENWPKDGEIDFAEDYTGARRFGAFSHFQNSNGEHDQTWWIDDRSPNVDGSQWHTWGCEWGPDFLRYTLDGKVWAEETDKRAIPHNKHWLGFVSAAHGPAGIGGGKIEIDWVKVYKYDPETQGGGGNPDPGPVDPTPEEPTTPKVEVGDMVGYVYADKTVAAVVTEINADGSLKLTAFRPNRIAYVKKAVFSETPKAKHWSKL